MSMPNDPNLEMMIPGLGQAGAGNSPMGGEGMSPSQQAAHMPSKVLYVRNIPETVTEQDVIAYCLTFGRVVNILLLRDKRHGFVEFEDEGSAVKCHNYYTTNPLMVTGHRLEFAFSGRTEITARKDPDANPPNRILLFTITNLVYPVTVDVITQVMQAFGGLEKVIVFNRGNAVQALVQLRDVETANNTKTQLDGQNIYAGCNTIKVQYSSLPQLEIKHNNDRSWDYTNPNLPQTGPSSGQTPLHQQQMPMGGGQSPGNLMANFNYVQAMNALSQANAQGNQNPAAAMAAAAAALQASMSGGGTPNGGGGGAMGLGTPTAAGAAPVVIVHGLNEQETRPDDLAALFAVYGNVVRVKIMYKARHTALVQMQDMTQCRTALSYLQDVYLHANQLSMEISKGGNIPPVPPSTPSSAVTAEQLTKDYSSQGNLYGRHRIDKMTKPFAPSISLHVSNMPDGTPEQDLATLLGSVGCQCSNIRFLDEQHHIAIVQCLSLDNAITTLCRAHGRLVGSPPRPCRIGFGHGATGQNPSGGHTGRRQQQQQRPPMPQMAPQMVMPDGGQF